MKRLLMLMLLPLSFIPSCEAQVDLTPGKIDRCAQGSGTAWTKSGATLAATEEAMEQYTTETEALMLQCIDNGLEFQLTPDGPFYANYEDPTHWFVICNIPWIMLIDIDRDGVFEGDEEGPFIPEGTPID